MLSNFRNSSSHISVEEGSSLLKYYTMLIGNYSENSKFRSDFSSVNESQDSRMTPVDVSKTPWPWEWKNYAPSKGRYISHSTYHLKRIKLI
jgi:hypothetical protein